MAFTGKWGAPEDVLGNVEPGAGAVPSQTSNSALALTQTASATVRSLRNVQAASQIVSLHDSVVLGISNTKPVSQSLHLTDMAFSPRQLLVSASDSISLSDGAEHGVFVVEAHQSLVLTDQALVLRLPSNVVTDTLTLTDFARLSERFVKATDVIAITDTVVWTGPHYVGATNPLITSLLVFDPVTVTLSSHIVGLSDAASANVQRNNLLTHQYISLSEVAIGVVVKAAGTAVDASDTLALTDKAQLSIVLSVSQTLTLTDSASTWVGVPLSNQLTLTDIAGLQISHAATTLLDTISLSDAVRFVIERTCDRFLFSPNIGSNSDPSAPASPPNALPAASMLTGFRLRFPSSGSPTDEVILPRKPEFGNIDRFQFDRINRESRGGTLLVFADPIWPKIKIKVFKFSSLKKVDAYALRDFMAAHPGLDIELIDHENRAWVGVITKQQDGIIQDDRNSFTASFEFEGERV